MNEIFLLPENNNDNLRQGSQCIVLLVESVFKDTLKADFW